MNTCAIPAGDVWSERPLRETEFSPFKRIGGEWMIVAAGGAEDWNGMTASWGGFGVLWEMDVAYVFVRPSRHTYGYTEKADQFSLSFFDESRRSALNYFGSHSGRDGDKAVGAGLTPIEFSGGGISFAEAREALICRKLYAGEIRPSEFIDRNLAKHYPKYDYHRLYIAAIERRFVRPSA